MSVPAIVSYGGLQLHVRCGAICLIALQETCASKRLAPGVPYTQSQTALGSAGFARRASADCLRHIPPGRSEKDRRVLPLHENVHGNGDSLSRSQVRPDFMPNIAWKIEQLAFGRLGADSPIRIPGTGKARRLAPMASIEEARTKVDGLSANSLRGNF